LKFRHRRGDDAEDADDADEEGGADVPDLDWSEGDRVHDSHTGNFGVIFKMTDDLVCIAFDNKDWAALSPEQFRTDSYPELLAPADNAIVSVLRDRIDNGPKSLPSGFLLGEFFEHLGWNLYYRYEPAPSCAPHCERRYADPPIAMPIQCGDGVEVDSDAAFIPMSSARPGPRNHIPCTAPFTFSGIILSPSVQRSMRGGAAGRRRWAVLLSSESTFFLVNLVSLKSASSAHPPL